MIFKYKLLLHSTNLISVLCARNWCNAFYILYYWVYALHVNNMKLLQLFTIFALPFSLVVSIDSRVWLVHHYQFVLLSRWLNINLWRWCCNIPTAYFAREHKKGKDWESGWQILSYQNISWSGWRKEEGKPDNKIKWTDFKIFVSGGKALSQK